MLFLETIYNNMSQGQKKRNWAIFRADIKFFSLVEVVRFFFFSVSQWQGFTLKQQPGWQEGDSSPVRLAMADVE